MRQAIHNHGHLFLFLAAAATIGCNGKGCGSDAAPTAAADAAASAPLPITSSAIAMPNGPGADGGASSVLRGSLGGALAYEHDHRPGLKPRAEDVLVAIEGAGVPLEKKAQHLGAPVQAAYCIGAESEGNGLSVSVCEYTSSDAAAAGAKSSRSAFGAIADRSVTARGPTTLTLLEYPKSDKSSAAARRVLDAFNKL